jgi:hypothetical protein
LATVFQPAKVEFLLLSPEPLGKVMVAPIVSAIPATKPVPPFALKTTIGFGLIGVVYRTITTPEAPALANPLPEESCEPPPPLFAVGAVELTPPPDDALPVDPFDPAPPLPYINVVPEISELTPGPPVVVLATPPAPPPPPEVGLPVAPPAFPFPLAPPGPKVLTGATPPFAVSVANLDCPPLFSEVLARPCVLIAAPPAPTVTATVVPGDVEKFD